MHAALRARSSSVSHSTTSSGACARASATDPWYIRWTVTPPAIALMQLGSSPLFAADAASRREHRRTTPSAMVCARASLVSGGAAL